MKIDQPGVPIRPIVSYGGSQLCNFNKYIANIKAYVKEEYNVKNSTTFSKYIRYILIKDDEIMVSFRGFNAG